MLFLKSGCAISTNNVRLCALKPSASIVIGTVPSNILSHQQNSHTHTRKHNRDKWINFFSPLLLVILFFAMKHNSIPHVECQSLSSMLSDTWFPVWFSDFGGGSGAVLVNPPILTGKRKKKMYFVVILRLCHNMTEHKSVSKLSCNKKWMRQSSRSS